MTAPRVFLSMHARRAGEANELAADLYAATGGRIQVAGRADWHDHAGDQLGALRAALRGCELFLRPTNAPAGHAAAGAGAGRPPRDPLQDWELVAAASLGVPCWLVGPAAAPAESAMLLGRHVGRTFPTWDACRSACVLRFEAAGTAPYFTPAPERCRPPAMPFAAPQQAAPPGDRGGDAGGHHPACPVGQAGLTAGPAGDPNLATQAPAGGLDHAAIFWGAHADSVVPLLHRLHRYAPGLARAVADHMDNRRHIYQAALAAWDAAGRPGDPLVGQERTRVLGQPGGREAAEYAEFLGVLAWYEQCLEMASCDERMANLADHRAALAARLRPPPPEPRAAGRPRRRRRRAAAPESPAVPTPEVPPSGDAAPGDQGPPPGV